MMASDEVNETLINMITNLKPQLQSSSFSLETPGPSLKRPNSSDGDLFDTPTPSKKFKLDRSNIEYVASPRETRRLRADLLEARNSIMTLENRVQHMHNVRKEMQLMFDNEVAGLKQQRKHDQKSIEDLENQLQTIRKRELETKNENIETKNKLDDLKLTTDQHIERLEKELAEVKVDLYSDSEQNSDEIVSLKQRNDELESLLDITREELDEHQNLLLELQEQLSKKEEVERSLEIKDQMLQKARLELKELEYLRENYEEYQQQLKSHYHKLSSYSELEKENQLVKEDNRRLHEVVQNKLLLEEEVHTLKTHLVRYKEQEKIFSALQTSQIQNELYLNEWKAVARGICESTGSNSTLPHLLRIAVERLQQQEINLTASKVELESQLHTSTHEAKVARSELEKNQKLLTELQTGVQQRQSLIHRLQKKIQLVSRERDSYRLQLDSYERDLTMCVSSGNSAQSSVQQTQKERIENLERMVEGYREMVAKLENDLQNVEPNFNSDNVPIRVEQLNRLKEEVDKLKLDNDHLREQKEQLEIRMEEMVIGGDLNTGRIIHFAKNPLAECIEEHDNNMEKLQEEVQRLKRKIRNLEDGLEASKLNESIMSPQEIQTLKDQLKSAENQTQRLKEIFKSSMQEFRNVIYLLFGYKVDKSQNSKYKLTSMYADQSEDQIWFQLNSDGTLNLLANNFSSTLDEFIDIHLRQQDSIPVFLSAITMDLFNNKTLASTKVYEVDDD